ncbi:MAG: hypothetical protein H7Y20_15070 [Bryobacteraceae bacterium]|nr:hypothetical protein [Bryobacteraceae bacterium]
MPTLSLFDLIANDLRNSFTKTPDLRAYEAVVPKQDLFEAIPPLSQLSSPARTAALETLEMRFDVPDAIPMRRYAQMIWHSVHGWDVPFPRAREAMFSPTSAGSVGLE